MIICGKYILEKLNHDVADLIIENCDLRFNYLNRTICIRFGIDKAWILVNHEVYLVRPKPDNLSDIKVIVKKLLNNG